MPTYDYACDACDHSFEIFESIMVEPQTKCPKCKKKKLRRLFGAGAGLVFKGSGFYQTDYRSESYKKSAAADKPASEGSTFSEGSGAKDGGSPKDGGSSKSETKASPAQPAAAPNSESSASSKKSKSND